MQDSIAAQRDFKGIWIPKEIWLTKELSIQEKILLVEIDSLDNSIGCFASNTYLADFLNLSRNRVSEILSSLKDKKYVYELSEKELGHAGWKTNRVLKINRENVGHLLCGRQTPSENRQTPSENRQTPSENRQRCSENREYSNPISNPIINPSRNPYKGRRSQSRHKKQSTIAKPTLEDITSYFTENGYSAEMAKKFHDYYSAGDWKDSKGNPVRSWKQKALAVWFKPENKGNASPEIPGETPEEFHRRRAREFAERYAKKHKIVETEAVR